MPIIFKLVGNVKVKGLEIRYDTIGKIKLSSIISIFESYGIPSKSFEYIQFITESETIKNDFKFFDISDDKDQIICVFTVQKEINEKLIEIFSKNTNNISLDETVQRQLKYDVELNKPIHDKMEEDPPELTQDIINSTNAKTIELFQKKNFKDLVKIYYSDPDMIKTFINFISHGDIVKMTIPKITEEKDYSDEIKLLKSLGIPDNDEDIIKVLKTFNGHINLSFRMLLRNKAINSEA